MKHQHLSIWTCAAMRDWLIIAAALTATSVAGWWPCYVLAWVVIGNRQLALHVLGHDGVHQLVCRNRFANDLLTNILSFWPLWTSLSAFRQFHFEHHRHVGTQQDPEVIAKGTKPGCDPPATKANILQWLARDLCGGGIASMIQYSRRYPSAYVG